MHPEKIKAELRIQGYTMARIADELGVCHSAISNVVSGKLVSGRIRNRIAEIVGRPTNAMWPERPLMRRSRAQHQEERAAA